jgi:NAD(P)-dependent dehydrogenase (short-subunit alcohol dehydrogenase family)
MTTGKKTVFITGCSSGIGLAAAQEFLARGWNVAATMRNPEKRRTPLHDAGLPEIIPLDVTDPASIRAAVQAACRRYGAVDAVVNNAGYALYGPFEAASNEQIARQFETNVFGLMAVAREFLPIFRAQGHGTLINVASMGGRIGFPLYSLYNASKWAVEGFSESLQYELRPLNIRVRLIEPGVIHTDFYDRSLDGAKASPLGDAYAEIQSRNDLYNERSARTGGSSPAAAARAIFRAATDTGWRLRYPAGNDAGLVSLLRRVLPEGMFYAVLRKFILG